MYAHERMPCGGVNKYSSPASEEYSRAAILESIDNVLVDEDSSYGLVTTTETLADCLNIRYDALMLPGVMRSCTSHATHYFVQDKESAVLATHFLHGLEIAWDSWHTSQGLFPRGSVNRAFHEK